MEDRDWINLALSGLVAAFVSGPLTWVTAKALYYKQRKTELAARLLASRSQPLPRDFFIALNEIPATFHNNPAAVAAWRTVLTDGQGDNNLNLIPLLRECCSTAGIDVSSISDDEFIRPFAPGPSNR